MFLIRIMAVMLFVFALPVNASDRGIGLVIGAPTGLTYKQWVSDKQEAIQSAIGWNTGNNASLQGSIDYIFHKYNVINVDQGKLPVYFGIGAQLELGTDFIVGLRFPLGLDYQFKNEPFDLFLELTPGMQFLPKTAFTLSPALGVRYFFD